MEPRAAIAAWMRSRERYTLIAERRAWRWCASCSPKACSSVPPDQIRVLTYDVGGGFGMKVQAYPEYAALLWRRAGSAGR